ncbi:hypothetical protein [Paraburkholderia caribensis]|uniref:hypothetical protein n=1 Tax=Paraburkholderia caribensis TaxID=75105 RepID=UPI001D0721B7|nr:hypothetical protein [Paraburkholderia caribensis]
MLSTVWLEIDGVKIRNTPANRMLQMLYNNPRIWFPVCEILHCKRTAGHMRLKRAREAIRLLDPLLGATLADVEWRGEWAMLSTTYQKCD